MTVPVSGITSKNIWKTAFSRIAEVNSEPVKNVKPKVEVSPAFGILIQASLPKPSVVITVKSRASAASGASEDAAVEESPEEVEFEVLLMVKGPLEELPLERKAKGERMPARRPPPIKNPKRKTKKGEGPRFLKEGEDWISG